MKDELREIISYNKINNSLCTGIDSYQSECLWSLLFFLLLWRRQICSLHQI